MSRPADLTRRLEEAVGAYASIVGQAQADPGRTELLCLRLARLDLQLEGLVGDLSAALEAPDANVGTLAEQELTFATSIRKQARELDASLRSQGRARGLVDNTAQVTALNRFRLELSALEGGTQS